MVNKAIDRVRFTSSSEKYHLYCHRRLVHRGYRYSIYNGLGAISSCNAILNQQGVRLSRYSRTAVVRTVVDLRCVRRRAGTGAHYEFRVTCYPEVAQDELIQDVVKIYFFKSAILKMLTDPAIYIAPEELICAGTAYLCLVNHENPSIRREDAINTHLDRILNSRTLIRYSLSYDEWKRAIRSSLDIVRDQRFTVPLMQFLTLMEGTPTYGISHFKIFNKRQTPLWVGVDCHGIYIFRENNRTKFEQLAQAQHEYNTIVQHIFHSGHADPEHRKMINDKFNDAKGALETLIREAQRLLDLAKLNRPAPTQEMSEMDKMAKEFVLSNQDFKERAVLFRSYVDESKQVEQKELDLLLDKLNDLVEKHQNILKTVETMPVTSAASPLCSADQIVSVTAPSAPGISQTVHEGATIVSAPALPQTITEAVSDAPRATVSQTKETVVSVTPAQTFAGVQLVDENELKENVKKFANFAKSKEQNPSKLMVYF
ncbi:Moesin/ezrin/radixin 1 [Thelohanellus kitauei]|uniref:Moesin/ezrin/radixin 1 n=1 Tax=Thelohanellus kitauei TaxID=669202 RepID=A0A0C2IHM9_THEKT|nr:Moesin/ezrin/radixin 1 [Thelohanellus kitauei]